MVVTTLSHTCNKQTASWHSSCLGALWLLDLKWVLLILLFGKSTFPMQSFADWPTTLKLVVSFPCSQLSYPGW